MRHSSNLYSYHYWELLGLKEWERNSYWMIDSKVVCVHLSILSDIQWSTKMMKGFGLLG